MLLREFRFPFKAMGSPCEVRLYTETEKQAQQVANAAIAEVSRLERAYSRYRSDSVLANINASAGQAAYEVDPETAGLLDYAHTAYEQSDGLFDITSGVLRNVWDFSSGRLPADSEVKSMLEHIGWPRVRWEAPMISLPEKSMQLDFGGYVKEYAVDAVVRLCGELGVESGLVDLGGDIRVLGPHPNGDAWQVGIRHPRQPELAAIAVEVNAGALASSGDYERYMEVGGRRYCHILNPETGWPCEGLATVAVAAPLCLIAGTAATVAMLKGVEEGVAWLEDLGLPYYFMTTEGASGGPLASEAH